MKKLQFLLLILMSVVVLGCDWGKKDKKEEQPTPKPEPLERVNLETMAPMSHDLVSLEDYGLPLEAKKLNDSTLIFQGDIMIPIGQELQEPLPAGSPVPAHKAVAKTKGLWPDNTLYYQIRSDVPANTVDKITEAIKFWAANSNVKFVNSTGPDGHHVLFYPGGGCSSFIGKANRGGQLLSVGSGCSVGNIMHEIAHALGFWHEQSRADRDEYIKIHYDNIKPGYAHNFKTYSQLGSDGQELSAELDFGSIMMYPSYSFSANGRPTITKLDGSTYYAQRRAPSDMDIAAMNMLYPETLPEEELGYRNGRLYFLLDLYVLRQNDAWWFYTRYGYKEVYEKSGYWFYKS